VWHDILVACWHVFRFMIIGTTGALFVMTCLMGFYHFCLWATYEHLIFLDVLLPAEFDDAIIFLREWLP
jgi:hypothetical protein